MNDGLRWVVTQFHLDTRFVDAMPFSYMKPLSGSGSKAMMIYFFSSRRRHTIYWRDWSSDVCSSDLISAAAALIKPGIPLDALAYGCTSGAMVIGEERVFALLRETWPGIPCTTPITAALAGLRTLGARRIALLTPYIDEINQTMRRYIEARGIAVVAMGSFNNSNDNEVARISAASLETAIRE